MVSIKTSLEHMAWADHCFLTELAKMDSAVLTLTNGDSAWSVGRAASHILEGVEWYRYLLFGAQWQGFPEAKTSGDVLALRDALQPMNQSLIDATEQPDASVHWTDDNGAPRQAPRSVILSQAAYHAAEHRAQITAALHAHGIRDIHLDDYDVWAWHAQQQS
ncbi:MAG: hypothetical protein RL745_425 [Actinomycetota bacterium]|jgi:uncharacterized damage-inducible protein DinB